MLKRFARLTLVAAVVLSSALNAGNDSFSYDISKELAIYQGFKADKSDATTECSMDLIVSQDGSDFDDLLVKTIKKLALEINPEKAAQMYLSSVKNTYDKAMTAINFESMTTSQNEDEFKQALGKLFQDLFNEITSKDALLEQAIYFATFSDETIKSITNAMSTNMQEYTIKIGNFEYTNDTQKLAPELKKLVNDLLTNCLNSMATVFEDHGYEIDRQSLGL